jgi:hypothetical protein
MKNIDANKIKLSLKGHTLKEQFAALDRQFNELLRDLDQEPLYEDNRLSTYRPVQIARCFEQKGLQRVREVSTQEMMDNSEGLRKLLANMLSQCRPGVLSQDDMEQMSGINGREMRSSL